MVDQTDEEQRLKEDSDRLSAIFFIYQKPKTKNQKRFHGAANPRRRDHDRGPGPAGERRRLGRRREAVAHAGSGPVAGAAHPGARAEVFVAGSPDWPFEGEWQGFFGLAQAGRLKVFYLSGAQIDGQGGKLRVNLGEQELSHV
jgi:hypothetical protein